MGKLAHCCEQFLRGLELPTKAPVVCSKCKNQIVFDLIENKSPQSGSVLFDEQYDITEPEYLEKTVTINTKEYEISKDWDEAAIQRHVLTRYLEDFPVYGDRRYRNSVLIIKSGPRFKALAKTAIIS